MAPALEPSIQRALVDFIHTRIDYIRTGDRHLLDLTYCPVCLNLRNEYNRHDYDWYMNLIENGFGVKAERIDIMRVDNLRTLPFTGTATTFPMAPDYKVILTTVTGRHTLWLVQISEDGPKVILSGI